MTTAICFDLDGTLVHLTRDYDEVLADVFETHLGESTTTLVETYDEAFFAAFEAFEENPYRQGMEEVLAEVAEREDGDDDPSADPDAMVDTLREAEYAATEVPRPARSAVEQLSEQASLGVITNGLPAWQAGKLDHHGVADYFDAVVTSYEAGAHKPDAAPFDLARERLPADEYAMVGDDYECDVEGARAAGFVPVHFEEDGPDFWETLSIML